MNRWIPGLVAMGLLGTAAEPGELTLGDPLPTLRGQFLSGRDASLPQAASGRVALLLLGFTYDSRFQVEAWTRRFRRDFQETPAVTFYEVPMIGGIARLGKWFIDRGMRSGTPSADHDHVITVYGGQDAWKQRVAFRNPKAAYLIVLDPQGKVAWRHQGDFDEARYRELAERVSNLVTKAQ